MSFKLTYILFAILAVMLGFLVLALVVGPAPPAGVWLFPSLHREKTTADTSDVERVEITRGEDHVIFEHDADGKTWKMTHPRQLRVDQTLVNELVNEVLNATASEKRLVTNNPAELGLTNPQCTVLIRKDNKDYRVSLGDKSAGNLDAVRYVLSSEREEPLAVRASALDLPFRSVNSFRSHALLAETPDKISYLKIQKGNNEPIVLVRKGQERGEAHWVIQEPARYRGDAEPGSEAPQPGAKPVLGVRNILDLVTALRVKDDNDFVQDNAPDKDLVEKYKLDAGDAALLRIETRASAEDKEGPTLLVGSTAPPPPPKDIKPANPEKRYYARLLNVAGEGDRNVFLIADSAPLRPEFTLDTITQVALAPGELRDRQLLRRDLQHPDALDVKNDSGSYRLRNFPPPAMGQPGMPAPSDWRLYRGDFPGKAERTDLHAVDALIRELSSARIEVFLGDKDQKPTLNGPVVKLWTSGFVHAAKAGEDSRSAVPAAEPKVDKPDNPDLELAFEKPGVDSPVVTVRRKTTDGETWVKVPVALYREVSKGALAYFDRNLPSFADKVQPGSHWTAVSKLEIQRSGTDYELVRDNSGGLSAWKFTKPAEFKDHKADTNGVDLVLTTLNNLQAVTLVSEQASEADLDTKYGLKNPRLRFTVTVAKGDKTETRQYLFDDSKEKDTVYAKLGDSPLVVTVDKGVLTTLDRELLDPVLWTIKTEDVAGMKLTGWSKRYDGQPGVLELERQGPEKWTLKTMQQFELDPAKVEALLTSALLRFDVLRYLTKNDPKPGDKLFDVNNNALEITILLKDGKGPYTVIVNREGDKGPLLGKSNQAPSVFQLPDREEKVLQPILEGGRGYFGKPK